MGNNKRIVVAKRYINKHCISFGITFNWNWKPGIEINFFIWDIYIEFEPLRRLKHRRQKTKWNLKLK